MTTFGTIALFIAPAATIGTALVAGWLLVFSGIIEMVHAFRVRLWGRLFLHLIGGVLGLLVGLLVVTHPLAGAVAWTLLFASFLSVVGLFRMIAAIRLKFPRWVRRFSMASFLSVLGFFCGWTGHGQDCGSWASQSEFHWSCEDGRT